MKACRFVRVGLARHVLMFNPIQADPIWHVGDGLKPPGATFSCHLSTIWVSFVLQLKSCAMKNTPQLDYLAPKPKIYFCSTSESEWWNITNGCIPTLSFVFLDCTRTLYTACLVYLPTCTVVVDGWLRTAWLQTWIRGRHKAHPLAYDFPYPFPYVSWLQLVFPGTSAQTGGRIGRAMPPEIERIAMDCICAYHCISVMYYVT
jgi:hypothetical protein